MVYEGNEDYIFISYAHKDTDKIMPVITAMHNAGYRLWYDSGIQAGTEWPEYIEDRLTGAAVVVVFMTPAAIDSRNCRNEINFAVEMKKEMLVIYLEETKLLKGMRLQLNSTQSLFRQNHRSDETFLQEIIRARILSGCREGGRKEAPQPEFRSQIGKNTVNISNICSIGSNDENDLWPTGLYSAVLNYDEFRLAVFHVNLVKPLGFSGSVVFKKWVYNSKGLLVYEDDDSLEVEADYDKFAWSWVIKGLDGSFMPVGEYRFVCSVHNSPEFTYDFTITSNAEEQKKQKKRGFFSWLKGL